VIEPVTTRLAAWVFETPRWKFLTVLFALMLVKTGVTFIAPAMLPIARNPYVNPFPNPYEHYLFWSWLGPWLAHQLGATSAFSFSLFYLVFSLLFSLLMVRWMCTRLPDDLARTAVLVFALLPVSAAAYYWVWTDSLTLFLLACTLHVPRNWLLLFALGVALGMQHFEQAAVGSAAALFALGWSARRGRRFDHDWRWALAILVGTIAGKVLLTLIFAHHHIEVNSGRWFWLVKAWAKMLRRFAYSYHFALLSAFGVAWLVMLQYARARTVEALPLVVTLGGLLLLMPISDDPTRVYAVVSFLVLGAMVLGNGGFLAQVKPHVGLLLLLWLLVPWIYVWSGRPIVSSAAYDVLRAVHAIIGDGKVPVDPRFPPY
jgi:MFS family permease